MILRRFIAHVTEQNWFAVGLDVLVVIVGIFLGLQVSEWNEQRKNQLEEGEMLARLVVELDESIRENRLNLAIGRAGLDQLSPAIELLLTDQLTDETMTTFQDSFACAYHFPTASIRDSVISEVMTTGKIGIMRSPDVRYELQEYYSAIEVMRNHNEAIYSIFLDLRKTIHNQIRLPLNYPETGMVFDRPDEISDKRGLFASLYFTHEALAVQLNMMENYLVQLKDTRLLISSDIDLETHIPQLPEVIEC